jgi:hypothetical protein
MKEEAINVAMKAFLLELCLPLIRGLECPAAGTGVDWTNVSCMFRQSSAFGHH